MTAHRPGQVDPEAGAVAVIVALLVTVVILPLSALVVDLGNSFVRQSDLQNAADLAALAGARALPDQTAAVKAAVGSLCDADNHVQGWAGHICQAPWTGIWPKNGTATDGEITFSASAGSPTIDTIRVEPPPAKVQYALAASIPGQAASGYVRAVATATAGTPLSGRGYLPFFLTADDGALANGALTSAFCIVDINPANAWAPSDACPDATITTRTRLRAIATRGYVDEALQTGGGIKNDRLLQNLEQGFDHRLHDYRYWPCGGFAPQYTSSYLTGATCAGHLPLPPVTPPTNVRCGGTPPLPGPVIYAPPWTSDVNCLKLGSGGNVEGNFTIGFTDRLRPGPATCAGVTTTTPGGSPIDDLRLLDPVTGDIDQNLIDQNLINPNLSGAQVAQAAADLAAGRANSVGAPLFTAAIYTCPRLGILPRLAVNSTDVATKVAGNNPYPIVGLSYVWIGSNDTTVGSDTRNGLIWIGPQLQGVRGYTIDGSFFPRVGVPSALLGPVVDGLPVTSRLIHNSDDPPT